MKPQVRSFFDPATFTISHVVREPGGSHCAIIDSVRDFDPKSGRTDTQSANAVIAYVREQGLTVDWILETHVHADHLTAAPYLKDTLGGQTGVGAHITAVQQTFGPVFNAGPDFATDGSQFDHLFADGETLRIGAMEGRVMHTPGHTPACVTYVFGDAAFVGDTLFMPDFGTARCDVPGGDATILYESIHKVLALPPETRLFMCHDYMPNGREVMWETTVAAEKAENLHVCDGVSEADFVKMRTERDAVLDMPVLILPGVQVNMRAGHLPPADDNGIAYLKLPIDAL
jgi:glyoxylase-like metal-dependent hydrolase (beta-lactamase superfamily II)